MSAPTATYRLQLHAGYTLDDAAGLVDYLAALGISHLYLSPILQAAPGSMHGYDVVDHTKVNIELGAEAGLRRLQAAARQQGLGLVIDLVPNHMAVGDPESVNAWWWDVLRHGRDSAYAGHFDIDWTRHDGRILLPVLAGPLDEVLDEITVHGDRVRYYDHVFPLAPAQQQGWPQGRPLGRPLPELLGRPLPELLADQHYELADWRRGNRELNYRRFFDVTTLAGIRVEEPRVLAASHGLPVMLARSGVVDGLRIDHPDGLADPASYLAALDEAIGGSWIVAEKILETGEVLPADWRCAGTTGYDALNAVLALLIDPAGEAPLTEQYAERMGAAADFDAVVEASKRLIVDQVLVAEVDRLTDELLESLGAGDRVRLRAALVELLVAVDVYRAYVEPGQQPPADSVARLDAAAERAARRRPDLADEVAVVRAQTVEGAAGFVIRFQQTCGAVMAKGVEDTAFYRYHRLDAQCEVGGDPGRFAASVDDFHAFCARLQSEWPATMTTLSTHDTKRSEDVRARLAVLAEIPAEWAAAVDRLDELATRHRRADGPDPNATYLCWQTLVGAWPLSAERAGAYLEKATREAKEHTSWVDPDPAYDDALRGYVTGLLADPDVVAELERLVERVRRPGRVNALTQKLVQLTMPGVPDIYQGCELEDLSLVDPDNRRPVDYPRRRAMLTALDDALLPPRLGDADGAEKLLVVARTLRLRREHPDWFGAEAAYRPIIAHGPAAAHVVGFGRGESVLTVVTRRPVGLTRRGGWQDTELVLPPGRWRDAFTGAEHDGARPVPLVDLLAALPVTLLARG